MEGTGNCFSMPKEIPGSREAVSGEAKEGKTCVGRVVVVATIEKLVGLLLFCSEVLENWELMKE